MNILDPSSLIYLLIIPPVVILYFMKLRRKEQRVPSVFLWKQVMQDARVDSFFQKLKVNILLILQILFILFVVFSLIRPYFLSIGVLSSETIFIIDTSAGMKAKEGNTTRFELAKDKINAYLNQARSSSSFMLITAGDSPEILSGFTQDREKIKSLVSNIIPSDTPSDLTSSVFLALSLLRSHPDAGIYLIGDKVPHDPELKLDESPNFHFISVGENSYNVGITSFDISRNNQENMELFVRVENFAPETVSTFLEISYNNLVSEARELNMKAKDKKIFVFKVPQDFAGVIKAEITIEDGLWSDNTAYAVVRKPQPLKILLISKGNLFIERILSLLPYSEVELADPLELKNIPLRDYQIILWDECQVPPLKTGNHIFFNCTFKDKLINPLKNIEYPPITSWETTHPLMRFVDLNEVTVAQGYEVKTPPGAKILVSSDDIPLIFLLERERFKGIFLSFSLFKTDWQLLPSFPIFLANAVEYMSGGGRLIGVENYRTGSLVPLEFIKSSSSLWVQAPSRTNQTPLRVSEGVPTLYLEQTGIYKVKSKGEPEDTLIPANLLSQEESDITPDTTVIKKGTTRESEKNYPLIREIWWELVLVALLLLILEWYIFNRRRV